jgi:hypothetical protein
MRNSGWSEGEEVSRAWTLDEDERLRKLALAGLSLRDLALEMGRSASSIRVRAIKLDVAIARDLNGMQKRKLTGRSSR